MTEAESFSAGGMTPGYAPRNASGRGLVVLALFGCGAYGMAAAIATIFYPVSLFVFAGPLVLVGMLAPLMMLGVNRRQGARAVPISLITPMLVIAVAMMPLWPAYLNMKFGPLPIITPPRLVFYALSACWLYDMVVSHLRRGQFILAFKRNRLLMGLVFFFFVLNAISVPIAEGTRYAGQEFIRQTIIWLLPFCAFATYVRSIKTLTLLLVALTFSATIAALIALIEGGTGVLLVSKLAPFIDASADWLRIATEAKSRDGALRAQATHTHPLSLGEFLGMFAPLALAFAVSSRGAARWLWVIALLIILGGIFSTNARAAIVASVIGMGAVTVVLGHRIMRDKRMMRFRPLIGLAVLYTVAASPVVAIGAHHLITGEAGTSAARSSQARLDQIEMAWPKIVKRPVGGYGTGRAASLIGYWGRTLSVDNYYLSLAVEIGLPGPFTFIGILVIAAWMAVKMAATVSRRTGVVLLGFACALIAFLTSRSILSQTGNLSYVFPLIGALAGAAAFSVKRAGVWCAGWNSARL